MPFFSFGKKPETSKTYSLSDIPLFSDLSTGEVKAIEKKTRLVEFHKGDRVYSQGDAPDAFYVAISGRFQVLQKDESGIDEKITNLYRNDHFGEISILTNRPHSVTIEALNDALAIRIGRDDFTRILSQIPSLSLHLSRLMGRRLISRDEKKAAIHAEIIAMYNMRSGVGKTSFVTNLALAIRTELNRDVIMVNMNPPSVGEQKPPKGVMAIEDLNMVSMNAMKKHIATHKLGFDYVNIIQTKASSSETERRITTLLTYLVSNYHFVLVDLPREIQEVALKVFSQSDVVYLLTDDETENLERCNTLSKQLKDSFHFKDKNMKVILSRRDDSEKLTSRQCRHIAGQPVFAMLPFVPGLKDSPANKTPPYIVREPGSPYAKKVRFLARELGNALVGLALGSGAAFGIAHIGVFKVLEEENVPIDVISGSSIGALLGGLWASGMTAKEIEDMALSFNKKNSFSRLIGLSDIMIPHWGIIKGNRMEQFIRGYLGYKTFEDLDMPLRILATNLATSEPEIFEEGDLVKAIRASCSIPGIFRAVRHGGKILVDGGVADPLPVSVLTGLGVKKIIAVNVLSGPKDYIQRREVMRQHRETLEKQNSERNRLKRFWSKMERRFVRSQTDNIFNVLMRTIQFMEYSMAADSAIASDVLIHAVVADSHWAEFYSADKFIKVGEERARAAMPEIRALLES